MNINFNDKTDGFLKRIPNLQTKNNTSSENTISEIFSNTRSNTQINFAKYRLSDEIPIPYPLSNEEIKKESCLDSLVLDSPLNDLSPKEVIKIGGNFLLGGIITGGQKEWELDGLDNKTNFKVWEWLFSDIIKNAKEDKSGALKTVEEIKQTIDQLKTYTDEMENLRKNDYESRLINLNQKALEYSRQINNLKPHQTLSLPGGWINAEGREQTVIYEFTGREDGLLDIAIITGAEFQLTESVSLDDNKSLLNPVVLYEAVEKELIFFNEDSQNEISPAFIQSLMEFQTLDYWDFGQKVKEENVLHVFKLLSDKKSETRKYGLATGKKGKTFSVSSTKQVIRKQAKDKNLYKQIIFHCKLRTMIATYHALKEKIKENTEQGELARILLRDVAINLSRTVNKLIDRKNPLIDEKFAKAAIATCCDLRKKLDLEEEQIAQIKSKEMFYFDLKGDVKPQRNDRNEEINLGVLPKIEKEIVCGTLLPSTFVQINTPKDFHEAVNELKKDQTSRASLIEIQHFIDQLPLPECDTIDKNKNWVENFAGSFWSQVPTEELSTYLEDLETLLNYYLDVCQKNSSTSAYFPKIQASLLTIYTVTHYLSMRMELYIDGQLGSTDLKGCLLSHHRADNHAELISLDRYEGEVYLGCQDFERTKKSFNYFKTYNSQRLCDFEFTPKGSYRVIKGEYYNGKSRSIFWENLAKRDPNLCDLALQIGKQRWPDTRKSHGISTTDEEKIIMILETSSDERVKDQTSAEVLENGTCNVLCEKLRGKSGEYNYNYLNIMQRISYKTLIAFKHGEIRNCSLNLEVKTDTTDYLGKHFYISHWSSPHWCGRPGLEGMNKKERELLTEHPRFSRLERDWRPECAEGEALMGGVPSDNSFANFKLFFKGDEYLNKLPEFWNDILLKLPQWELAPHQMIYFLGKYFKKLKDLSTQRLIRTLLFRSPVDNSSGNIKDFHLGTGELLIKNEALVEAFEKFIHNGMSHYSLQKENDHIKGLKFILSLAFTASTYLKDANLKDSLKKFNLIDTIDRRLDQETDPKNKSILHFYKVLFFSLLPREELTPTDWQTIYQSWTIYRMSRHGDWEIPVELEHAENFVLTLSGMKVIPALQDDKQTRNQLANSLLNELGVEKNKLVWNQNNNLLQGKIENQDKVLWTIDLAAGAIYSENNHKIGYQDGGRPWESSKTFSKLFGEGSTFQYAALGNGIYTFLHPTYGQVRIFQEDPQKKTSNWVFQRKFSQRDQWYQAVLELPSLHILNEDHITWLATQEGSIKGYITSIKDDIRRYAMMDEGRIIEVNSTTGLPDETSHFIDFINKDFLPAFDKESNILTYRSLKNEIKKIGFARYTSTEGRLLEFVETNGKMAWSEDKEYVLPKKMPQHYLGTMDKNVIYLESIEKKGKGKLFVPFTKISQNYIAPIPSGELIDGIPKPEKPSGWKCNNYFTFDVKNGVLKPTSDEAHLYLAYMRLSQKDYEGASLLLKKIKTTTKLSPMGLQILKMITDMPFGEDHPDAKMVKFMAFIVHLKQEQEYSKHWRIFSATSQYMLKKMSPTELSNIIAEIRLYLQSHNNVSNFCRLSEEDESFLLKIIIEASHYRKEEILKDLKSSKKIYKSSRKLIKRRLQNIANNVINEEEISFTPEKTVTEDKLHWASHFKRVNEDFLDEIKIFNYKKSGGTQKCFLSPYTQEYLEQHEQGWGDYSWASTKIGNFVGLYTNCYGKSDTAALLNQVTYLACHGQNNKKREMLFRLRSWQVHKDMKKDTNLEMMIQILCAALTPGGKKPSTHLYKVKNDTLSFFTYLHSLSQVRVSGISQQTVDDCIKKLVVKKTNKSQQKKHLPLPLNYPVPQEDSHQNGVKNKDIIPLVIDFPKDADRWKQLKDWKDLYSQDGTYENEKNIDHFNLEFKNDFLGEEEKAFTDPLAKDLSDCTNDYEKAKNDYQEKKIPIIDPKKAKIISQQTEEKIREIREIIKKKKDLLLNKYANKRVSTDQDQTDMRDLTNMAKIVSKRKKVTTFCDCLTPLLSLDQSDYKSLNEHLNEGEMKEAAELTLEIEDLNSFYAQLKRIKRICHEIVTHEDPLRRKNSCHKLDHELQAGYFIKESEISHLVDKFIVPDDNKSPFPDDIKADDIKAAFRVFSGQTGMLLHEKQIKLIISILQVHKTDPKRFYDIIFQLIMGGGKTKVIATIILYLVAKRKDRLGVFMVPASLFEVVKSHLGGSFFHIFNKHILSIDVEREDLQRIPTIEDILDKIKKAENDGCPIIIKPTTLQSFQLELLSRVRKVKNDENLKKSIDDLKPLVKICRAFSKQGDTLMDEIDLILDCLQEVNFPEGELKPISRMENDLLHEIYQKALISNTLKVSTLENSPSIAQVVRLTENNQSLMDTEVYKKHVVPVIAHHLAENYAPLTNKLGDHQKSFERYASGKILPVIQTLADDKNFVANEESLEEAFLIWKKSEEERLKLAKSNEPLQFTSWKDWGTLAEIRENIAFLRQLDLWYNSENPKTREIADLIALVGVVLLKLTPFTLSQSGKRNYGPDPKSNEFKIIPYLAVNTPAITKFGYHLEEACYYYQWLAAFSIQSKEVADLGHMLKKAARHYASEDKQPIENMIEYRFFSECFGINLFDTKNPLKLEQASEYIENNIASKIDVAYEFVQKKVAFRRERLSSNNMSLLDQLFTKWGMSGTPWNVEGFMQELVKRFEKDVGTEGKILHTLAEKKKNISIQEVGLNSVEEFLKGIFDEHPSPEKIRGIIEVGGLFKKFGDNSSIAHEILNYLQKIQEQESDLQKKTVDPQIRGVLFFEGDTIYMWEKGAEKPTKLDNFTQKNIDPAHYFVFYDERHTTGTDIPQVADAINIVTFDKGTLIRDFEQGILRLRQLFYAQNIILAVTEETRKCLINGGKSLEDFILTAQKTQTLRKTEDMVTFFRQQIDNFFRRQAIEAIFTAIENCDPNLPNIARLYAPYFVNQMEDSFYALYGKIRGCIDTKKMLENELESKWNNFYSLLKGKDDKAIKAVEKDIKQFKKYLKVVTCLPKEWQDTQTPIGLRDHVEIQTETHHHEKVQVKTRVNIQDKLELQIYEKVNHKKVREDFGTSENQLHEIIINLRKEKTPFTSLKQQLGKYKYHNHTPYQNIFETPIYGTDNYFYTTKESENYALPVFNKLFKPPEQILAVETEWGIRWLLLSHREAGHVQKHLTELCKQGQGRGVWLILPNGDVTHSREKDEKFPVELWEVRKALLEINALFGDIKYLKQNGKDYRAWLETEKELKLHFLELKRLQKEGDTPKKALDKITDNISYHICKHRHPKETKWITMSSENVKVIKLALIPKLHVSLLHLLYIDWENQETCPLTKKAIETLKLTNKEKANRRLEKAFNSLSSFQMAMLPENFPKECVQRISSPEKIELIPTYLVKHLSLEQLRYITEHQAKGLSNEQIKNLPKEFPERKIKWIVADAKISSLPLRYTKLLSLEQIAFAYKEQIEKLTDTQIEFVPPDLVKYISLAQLRFINKDQAKYLCDDQIKKLPENFSKDKINAIVAPEKIRLIPPSLAKHFSVEQVIHATEDQVKEFSIDQMSTLPGNFSKGRVNLIVDPAKIVLMPPYLAKHFSKEQVIHATESQVKEFSIDQIATLPANFSKERVNWIVDSEKIKRIPPILTKHFSKEQVIHATERQVKEFSIDQMAMIPEEKIKWAIADERITSIPLEFTKNLSPAQAIFASDNQIRRLTREQIENLSPQFPLQRIHHIAYKNLRFLKKPEEIKSLGFMKVQHLLWTQLKERHWFWNTVYVVGVVVLGIVSTALALLAYLTLIPFVIAYIKHRPGKPNCVFRWLNANSLRVVRLAWVTCTGQPYAL